MTHDHLEDSIADLVLGAAEPEEGNLARAHLSNCASCRKSAEQFAQVVEMMPLLTDQVPPPTRLRQRILTAASTERKVASQPPRFEWLRAALRLRPGLRPAWALLGIIGLGLISWNIYLTSQLTGSRQLATTQYQLAAASPTLSSSKGQVISLPRQQLGLINLQNLPQPGEGKIYELWLKNTSGQMVPSQTFRPDSDGSKLLLLNQDLAQYSLLAMTAEPGPQGSPQPTEKPIMVTQL
ncbi:MAG: anti-sigma factor [Candidatus Dormibacteraceae bacterium]